MSPTPRPRDCGNLLLDRLPADEFRLLEPDLRRVELALKQVVHQPDAEVAHAYFPTTALISLLVVPEEDDPVESGVVGREGFVGLASALGVDASPHRAICQLPGEAFQVPARALRAAMEAGSGMTRLVHRYAAFAHRDIGQIVACNALHSVEERTSRWLLQVHDQAGDDEFPMTHEFLAAMLGARRQGVTVVLGNLRDAGLISHRRGRIVVLDRAGLEASSCACYGAVARSRARLLG